MDLSILIVNWNVTHLLRRCLASIVASPGVDVYGSGRGLRAEVIVVDNASTDGSPEMVAREFPWVRLIRNQENVGFTRANNQALDLARGRYLLFLNPDTEVVGEALQIMVRYMEAHPDVGVLGPQLRYADGRIQPSRRRFPTLATAFLESTILQQWWPDNPIARRYYVADRSDDEEQDVDWVVGACFMTRRHVVEQIGGFDERFFMYSEELDWCRRARAAGWRVVYLPTARVIHHEGKSSEQAVAARHIHFQSSKVLYFRKHHGAFAAELVRVFLLASYVYQWAEEAVKWLLGHRRPLRRQRMAAYIQVLRSGLRGVRR
ncbi:MAG TPA: glycosyltransferase family 2 protein [Caldilineae bacterium]|nr:glycosyltransferase family 2 protein [Caldilineae bacterium]